jgi:hypothetical protein
LEYVLGACLGFFIDGKPAAVFGSLVIVGRGENVDELGDFFRLEVVDVAGFGGEGGDLIGKQCLLGGMLEQAFRLGFAIGLGDGFFTYEVVVAGVDFTAGAEDHAGHAGVVMRGNGLIFFELDEANGEVEAFF